MKIFSVRGLLMSFLTFMTVPLVYGAEEISNQIDAATLQAQLAQEEELIKQLQKKLKKIKQKNKFVKESNESAAKQIMAYDARSLNRNRKREKALIKQIKELVSLADTMPESPESDKKSMELLSKQLVLAGQLVPLKKRITEIEKFREMYRNKK